MHFIFTLKWTKKGKQTKKSGLYNIKFEEDATAAKRLENSRYFSSLIKRVTYNFHCYAAQRKNLVHSVYCSLVNHNHVSRIFLFPFLFHKTQKNKVASCFASLHYQPFIFSRETGNE